MAKNFRGLLFAAHSTADGRLVILHVNG